MFTHNFNQDLEILINEINKEPFAFLRFADGEHSVLEKINLNGYDWKMDTSYYQSSNDMNQALSYRDNRYFYGISCTCCDKVKANYYKNKLSDVMEKVTYSNIFVNGNYKRSLEWLNSINKDVWLLANDKATNSMFPFKSKNIYFSSDILTIYEKNKNSILNSVEPILKDSNKLILVAVGPMSEILIHYLWTRNKNNFYIDIGSIIDPYIHGSTRIYHHDNRWKTLNCTSL